MKIRILSCLLGLALAAPALAADKAALARGQSGLSACVKNLNSVRKASAAITKTGHSFSGKPEGIHVFISPDKTSIISIGHLKDGERMCSMIVKGNSLRGVNALGARYAKQLKAAPYERGDPRVSKKWIGTMGNRELSVFTIKSANGGFFKAPSLNVMTFK